NGVQMLDGPHHHHRKQMFMSLMTSDSLEELSKLTNEQLQIASRKWEGMDKVVLFDEMEKVMCRIACQWAGVPLWARELNKRAADLGKLIDAFGAVGPRHWQGRSARTRVNKWAKRIIENVRRGNRIPSEDTPVYIIAWHRDLDGKLLKAHV